MRHLRVTYPAILALAAGIACTDPTAPSSPPEPVGNYEIAEFTITTPDTVFDEIAEGVTLRISLAADGSTSGALSVPAATPVPLDLTGSWHRQGDSVTFAHTTRVFLDLLTFTLVDHRLVAEGVVGPGRFRVVLDPADRPLPRASAETSGRTDGSE